MTVYDRGRGSGKTRQVSVRIPIEILDMVEDEREKRGVRAQSPIFVEAMQFYFDHKNDPLFKSDADIDILIEDKMDSLLTDPNRIEMLRKLILRV